MTPWSHLRWLAAAAAPLVLSAGPALASENGASLYLLGSGGPEAAVMPPVKGVFLSNTAYVYSGSGGATKQFVIGGSLVADVDASFQADFLTLAGVPSTRFAGGTLLVGGALPLGHLSLDASTVITGPLGRQIGVSISDASTVFGDPVATAALGWTWGRTSVQVSTLLNIPVGDYRYGALANLAFHRWAGDASLAGTWHDDASGWDLSAKAGLTFNGTNHATDYTTGTELHLEGSVEKTLSKRFSLGAQAYYFDQLTGDSGPGAKLGPYEGRVVGVGGQAAWRFSIGKTPATLRLHGISEFDARNRLEGHAVFLDFSMPLKLILPRPPGAG